MFNPARLQRGPFVWHGVHSQGLCIRFWGGLIVFELVLFLAGCASQVSIPQVSFQSGWYEPVTIWGSLYHPKGTGPFPAMVLLHSGGGQGQVDLEWARWLAGEGYVALAVDSFSSRGVDRVSGRQTVANDERAWDAIGALAYLRSLPFVDRERIGVMGRSSGAGAALTNASETGPHHQGHRFRVAIALYTSCSWLRDDTSIPVLLLLGEWDDWSDAGICVYKGNRLKQQGRTVLWKVYPKAYHGFDNRANARGRETLGHFLIYDHTAAVDSKKRIRSFLAQYLRRDRGGTVSPR